MNDLMTQHEDVGSDASRTAAAYITVALAAAQRLVDLRARAADRRSSTPDAAGPDDPHPDLAAMGAMLGPDQGRDASSQSALQAWTFAQPHRDNDSDAALVAGRAEDRLRTLHPDAMARYDQLRHGLDPVAAMREVTPLINQELQRASAVNAAPMTVEHSGAGAAGGPQVAAPMASQDAGQPPGARLQQVVRDVLEVELAGAVLTDDRWPQLAAALDRAGDLGADPGALLRDVAAERELATAKSPAQVLEHRLDQRTATSHPQRSPTAADLAASSFPTALPDAPARARAVATAAPDLAVLGAVLDLERDAATERGTARAAATQDDPATEHVDEHADGAATGQVHQRQAAAQDAQAAGLQQNAVAGASPAQATATDVAALSYPQQLAQATPRQNAPEQATAGAPAATVRPRAHTPTATARRR